jgi:hypothetical protein
MLHRVDGLAESWAARHGINRDQVGNQPAEVVYAGDARV